MTVMVLSGIMVGTTVIAGTLIKNQIRQTVGVVQSNQAIYAADAGLEWELYRFFVNNAEPKPSIGGASIQTCSPVGTRCAGFESKIRSIGTAGRTSRAFEAIFE
ncbi:MAG: hypothetical protein UX23_C0013G0006 [Parcubacteria group bacterium GW2011_GWB1_45_9]|nr:MAG: hypothetical protein UX23_C0013G0006 [Parcubacteria group bacterium GW2011_GWB1_45_9]